MNEVICWKKSTPSVAETAGEKNEKNLFKIQFILQMLINYEIIIQLRILNIIIFIIISRVPS